MNDTETRQLERTPRYQVRAPRDLSVTVTTPSKGTEAKKAELLDLSRDGARLSIPFEADCDDTLRLRMESNPVGLDVSIDAVVRWIRPTHDKVWVVGCAFATPISTAGIDALTLLGYLELDELARGPLTGEMTAWREARPAGFTVQLVDLSPGGVSLLSPDPAPVGQRLRLVHETPDDESAQIIVQIRCCAEVCDGYFLGCKFETRSAYGLLKTIAPAPPAARQRAAILKRLINRHSQLISRTSILILGGILVGMSVGLPAPHLTLAGLFSVIAYLGLELVADGRRRRKESNWQRLLAELIDRRLEDRFELLQSGWTAEPIE